MLFPSFLSFSISILLDAEPLPVLLISEPACSCGGFLGRSWAWV